MSFNLEKEVATLEKKVSKAKQTFIDRVTKVYNYNQDRIGSIDKTTTTLEEEREGLLTECVELDSAMKTINNEGTK